MKKIMLSVFAAISALWAFASGPIVFKGSDAAVTGVYIAEIPTGKVTAAHNHRQVFIPASVMKTVTAAVAQWSLGEGAPFSTAVEAKGEVRSGILEGNLYITGGGDPTLGSRHFGERVKFTSELAGWLHDIGVDSIAGDIIVDSSVYPSIGVSPHWLLEDTAWEYGAGLYGVNYRDNSFSMTVYPGREVTRAPYDVEVENLLHAGASGNVTAMRGEGSSLLTLYGTVSRNKGYTSRYSIPVPWLALYHDVTTDLSRAGIGVGATIDIEESGEHRKMSYDSPPRDEILRSMMFESNNLFAEGMLRALVLHEPSPRGFAEAVARERELLEGRGYDLSSIKIADGSGLAVTNRLSPLFLGTLLRDMASSSRYVALFPKAGKEGTVTRLLADTRLKGGLALKSGSMSGVMCYAGYRLGSSGKPTHVVVVMVNGFTCKTAEVRKAIARYLLSVF